MRPFRLTLPRALCLAAIILFLLTKTASVHAQSPQRTIVSRTRPVYPAFAVRMHISGSVLLFAINKPDGTVTNVRATTGHAFLQGPAEQAVRQWKFTKTVTLSETTVAVHFDLDPHS